MMWRKKALCLALGLSPFVAQAFVVQSIQYQGLQRIPVSAIAPEVSIKVGQDLTTEGSNQLIQNLFSTGYFQNIALLQQGSTLIIKLDELPTIAKIDIKGNELIKTDDLKTVLNNVGLQVGNMFSQTLVNEIQQSLVQEYNSQGKYAVKVTVEVKPDTNNRVNLVIDISEGLDAKIQTINFVGNHAFSNAKLLKQIDVSTPGLFSFFTKDDVYNPQKFNKAMQQLVDFYKNNGYVDVQVASAQASLDSTNTKAYMTISIVEGAKYQFAGFALKGQLILPEATLAKLVSIKTGDTYSQVTINAAQQALIDALGDEGYAFANVNPVPTLDTDKHTAFITFYVTPGQKVYVDHVNFVGNTVTNDKTLRQRTRFVEGSTYSKTKIDESTLKLQQLPYLQDVSVATKPVAGTPDKVDVDYHMKEQSANSVTGALGYSALNGVIFQAGYNMSNVFGTGNIFGINASLSRPAQSLNMSYTQPFFTDSGISQTESFYLSRIDTGDMGLTNYSVNSYGATLGYGIPLSTWNTFSFGFGLDRTSLAQPGNGYQSETVTNFISEHGSMYNTYSVNFGLSRDTTNHPYFPTRGVEASTGVNIAMPGSSLTWYKLNASGTWYQAINQYFVFSLEGGASYGDGYGNLNELPFYQNYFAGDWGTVRGYTAGNMGPQDTQICTNGALCTAGSTQPGAALGGNLLVHSTATLRFPIPFMTDNQKVRLITFVDSGNVYNTYTSSTVWNAANDPHHPNFSNIRYTTGFGVEWVSPLGAVGISFAFPLNKQTGDDTRMFQFTLGTFF